MRLFINLLRLVFWQLSFSALAALFCGWPVVAYSQWYAPSENEQAKGLELVQIPWSSVDWESAKEDAAVIMQLELAKSGPLANFLDTHAENDGVDEQGFSGDAPQASIEGSKAASQHPEKIADLLRKIFQPKLTEPSSPILVDPDGLAGIQEPVYYVNGMWRTRLAALEDASILAKQLKRPVWLVHNPSHGEPGSSDPADYLELLRYAAFLNLPAPSEALIQRTLEAVGRMDVPGLGEVSLGDFYEALWDQEWDNYYRLSPTFTLSGETHRLIPPQHNLTTRQLAHLLCNSEKKISIASHEQGCLIVRNAVAIAEHQGRSEWLKENIAWVPMLPPFSEQQLPLQVQQWSQKVQFVFPRGHTPATSWLSTPVNWQHLSFQWQPLMPLLEADLLAPIRIWPTPYRNAAYFQVANHTGDRVRIWVQFRHFSKKLSRWTWVPEAPPKEKAKSKQKREALTFDLEPGQTLDLTHQRTAVRAARVRIWAESELGWRRTEFLDRDLWLVNRETGRYIADKYKARVYVISEPRVAQQYRNRQLFVTNPTGEPYHVDATVQSVFADGHRATRKSQQIVLQPGESSLLYDSEGWPLYGDDSTLSIRNQKGDKRSLNQKVLLNPHPYRLSGGMGKYYYLIRPTSPD